MLDIFVTTQWLADRLERPDIAVIDGSWRLPPTGVSAAAEFLAAHIPGAVHVDIDVVRDTASPLPHMLPNAETFAELMGRLGVSEGMTIVVYDQLGLFAAPRVRFMLMAFGARDVRLLEGGLPRWVAEGRPTESGPAKPVPTVFKPRPDMSHIADLDRVRDALATGSAQIVDARPADRFRGDAPEPRSGVSAGHMPGSRNLPFPELLVDGSLKDHAGIDAAFAASGVNPDQPVIASCGSGVTAAIIALALEATGRRPSEIYDGSWAEWGSRPELPVATGSAEPSTVTNP